MPDRTENAQGILSFPAPLLRTSPTLPHATAPTDDVRNEPILACEDNLSFMERLADGHIKLVVTSLPYNIGKGYEDKLSLADYLDKQARVIQESVRVLHPQGSICWQVGNYVDDGEIVPLDAVLYPIFRAQGLKLRNRIMWHFGHGLHCTRRLSGRYETINWWTKGDCYTWNLDPIRVPSKYPGKRHFKGPNVGKLSGNPKGKNPGDVWEFPNVKSNHPEKTVHPCQFPVELVERLVLSMTDENDAVLDPYMGVGSSVIAAFMHNRRAYGCDIVPEYVDIARQRVDQLRAGRLRTRPMGKPIYDPNKPNGGIDADQGPLFPPQRRGISARSSQEVVGRSSGRHSEGGCLCLPHEDFQGKNHAGPTAVLAKRNEPSV